MTAAPGRRTRPEAMVVAGVMSGTSADGIDVALCRVSPGEEVSNGESAEAAALPRVEVLAHHAAPYSAELRGAVLAAMDAGQTSTAELARLSWRLGAAYAEAIAEAMAGCGATPALIALHGQTLYHQAEAAEYLGEPVRSTWQAGEPAVVAERLRLPVISDFRTADLAAGGQGAPLVPMLDLCQFRHERNHRVLLNLGGIANLTALPAGCDTEGVLAFDTGPANMVIDAAMQQLYGRAFDCGGGTGARGTPSAALLRELLEDSFLARKPPKSCGREQFGVEFAKRLIARGEAAGCRRVDIVATATAFTAESILEAFSRFVVPHLQHWAPRAAEAEVFASGGGAHNAALMRRLREGFAARGCALASTEDAGGASVGVEAKEAAAFALLGWLSWHGLPGNVPAATGAHRAVVLGRLTLG